MSRQNFQNNNFSNLPVSNMHGAHPDEVIVFGWNVAADELDGLWREAKRTK